MIKSAIVVAIPGVGVYRRGHHEANAVGSEKIFENRQRLDEKHDQSRRDFDRDQLLFERIVEKLPPNHVHGIGKMPKIIGGVFGTKTKQIPTFLFCLEFRLAPNSQPRLRLQRGAAVLREIV